MRTTSAMRSGSQAISVRIENVPTSTHSPGEPGDGGVMLSMAMGIGSFAPLSPGWTMTVSPGGATPLSDGQVHWRVGMSSCSATARKLRLAPSMVSVTGVAWPVRRTISAACRSASAVADSPAPPTESASRSNWLARRAPSLSSGGAVPPSPQPIAPSSAAPSSHRARCRIEPPGRIVLATLRHTPHNGGRTRRRRDVEGEPHASLKRWG